MHTFKSFLINCGTVGWRIKNGLYLGPRPLNHAQFPKNNADDYVYELTIKVYSNLSPNTHQGITIFKVDGMV